MSAMTKQMRKPVRVAWVRDILQPVNSKSEYVFPFLGNGCLVDYIPAEIPITEQTVVRQNGHYIPQHRWTCRGVLPGDEIYIGCVPGGIGAAIIGSAALIGTSTATTLGVVGAIAIELALSVGLSYLAAMLTDQPDAPDASESQTYGGGRITTRSQHGAVIPDVYGEHIVGGNVIASYTGHQGGKPLARGTHTISVGNARHNVILGLANGPIHAIAGLTSDVSGQFFTSNEQSMTVYSRLGQTPVVDIGIGTVAESAMNAIRLNLEAGKRYVIKNITLDLKRHGVLTGKKLQVGVQAGTWPPSGTWLAAPKEIDCSLIPTSWKEVSFTLPEPVEIAPTANGTWWIVLDPGYAYSATNYMSIGSIANYVSYTGSVYYYNSAAPTWMNTSHMALAFIGSTATPYVGTENLLKINGSSAESYAAVGYVSTRLGSRQQGSLPNTSKASLEIAVDQDLPYSETHWVEQSTQNEVDGIGIVIEFPNGIYYTNTGGHREGTTVSLNIRWRVTDTTEWLGFAHVKEELFSENPDALTVRIPFPTEKNRQFHQFRGSKLDVAVQRTKKNDQTVTWRSLQEYNDDQAQTYPYTALLQLDTDIGTSQGAIDSITTRIQGHKVHQYDTNGWSNYGYSANPAWCCLHYLLNPISGGGNRLTTANIDMDSFVAWATYCDEMISDGNGGYMTRWSTGLVIDTEKAFWDWAKQIASTGRCKLIRSGHVIRAKVEQAEDQVQMFTAGNTVAGSFKLQYVAPNKRPNAVDVKFLDADLDFAENIATAEDRSMRATGEPDIREAVDLYGCTSLLRAKRHAKFLLNVAKNTEWVAEFDTFIDAIACEPGDPITISNDAINWEAIGGRLKENPPGPNGVKLDRDLVIDNTGDVYKITVRTTVAGQDALLTSTVIEGPGTYVAGTTIDISPSWTTTPVAGDVYSVMPLRTDADTRHDRGAKVARIVATSVTDDFFVHIKCMQYHELNYHDDPGIVPVPAKVEPLDGRIIPPPVANLVARPVAMGNGVAVNVSWTKSTWPYPYQCEIWVRRHGAARHFSEFRTRSSNYTFPNVDVGSVWDVAICPCAPWTGAHRNPEIETRATVYVTEPAWNTGRNVVTGLSF